MRLALLLALAALPLPGQPSVIGLYTQFLQPASASVEASLHKEVTSIMASMGLEFAWRPLTGRRGNEVWRQLAVIKLKGTCDGRLLSPNSFFEGALGWTHVVDGEILPFMDVDCDRIRAFIRRPLSNTTPEKRDEMLGRAVGRVVAHELYHILGRTMHHGSGAASVPAYTVEALTGDEFLIEDTECRILEPAAEKGQVAAIELRGSSRRGRTKFVEKHCDFCHGAEGEGTRRAPALRVPGHPLNAIELATRLGMEVRGMCRRAEQLKIVPPSLGQRDLADLVRFLNDGM